jgi:hypothetical protein
MVSQADANANALAIATERAEAHAAFLRSQTPCFYDAVQYATRTCSQYLDGPVHDIAVLEDGTVIIVGEFYNDRSVPQSHATRIDPVTGKRLLDWLQEPGFTP